MYYGVNAKSEINSPKEGKPSGKLIYFLQLSGNVGLHCYLCLFFEIYVSVLCVYACEYKLGVHVENNFMP